VKLQAVIGACYFFFILFIFILFLFFFFYFLEMPDIQSENKPSQLVPEELVLEEFPEENWVVLKQNENYEMSDITLRIRRVDTKREIRSLIIGQNEPARTNKAQLTKTEIIAKNVPANSLFLTHINQKISLKIYPASNVHRQRAKTIYAHLHQFR
jgi:hypothetical protein